MVAEKYRLSSDDGLYVSEVQPESPADRAGVKKGDVIVQLGRCRVTGLRDFSTVLKYLPEHGKVLITLIRGDQLMAGALEL